MDFKGKPSPQGQPEINGWFEGVLEKMQEPARHVLIAEMQGNRGKRMREVVPIEVYWFRRRDGASQIKHRVRVLPCNCWGNTTSFGASMM